jgi:hypothetical protein
VEQRLYDQIWDEFEDREAAGDLAWVWAVLELYARHPGYTVLNQGLIIHRRAGDLDPAARRVLWQGLRAHLVGDDDELAEPIMYALWEDLLHDPLESEVWEALVGAAWPVDERLLERLLPRTGPAAPALKYPLYERLLDEQPGRWDALILAGLLDALDWLAPRIDQDRVDAILLRLDAPAARDRYLAAMRAAFRSGGA